MVGGNGVVARDDGEDIGEGSPSGNFWIYRNRGLGYFILPVMLRQPEIMTQ